MNNILKKIENNKKLKVLIYIIFIILIAGFNFLYFNYYNIKSDYKLKNIDIKDIQYKGFDLKDNKLVSIKEKAYIELPINHYINNLKFDYKTKENVDLVEILNYKNLYKKSKIKKINYVKYYDINETTFVIRKYTNSIRYKFKQKNIEISNIRIDNRVQFNFYTFLYFTIIFSLIYILILKRNYFTKNIEKGFLLISLTFGITITLLSPALTGACSDDQIHYKNSYLLFHQGNISKAAENSFNLKLNLGVSKSIEERKKIIKSMNNMSNQKSIKKYEKIHYDFRKISYIPSNIVLKICDAFHISYYISFILGKLVFVFIYSFVCYLAIKIIPVHKKLLTYICLLPTLIFYSTQYSYDNMVTPFVFLAFSIFIYEIYDKSKKINSKYMIIFIISILISSFTKAVYAPIMLIMLLLPAEKFNSKKQMYIFKICIIAICLTLMATFVLPTITSAGDSGDTRGGSGVSMSGQLRLIKQNPLSFIRIFTYNVVNGFEMFFYQMSLTSLSYYGIVFSKNIYYITLFGLFFFVLTDVPKKDYLSKYKKILVLGIILFIICLIWGSLLLSFTEVGEVIIKGVAGRYFLPLLFPLLACFSTSKIQTKFDEETSSLSLLLLTTIILLVSFYLNIILEFCL